LNAIILRLLAKKAEHRIQTATDFCAALENLGADGQPKQPAASASPARGPQKLANYDELSTTTEDLPAVQLPEVAFSEEDRRKEIEELRAGLGLHIEEPATDSQEVEQMSALVIDLGSSHASPADCKGPPRTHEHSLPLLRTGPKARHSARPVEERQYVPPLAAPSTRASAPAKVTTDVAVKAPSRAWKIVRGAIVLALLIAATVVAFKFVK
jgi:hypothetical protein